MPLKCAHCDKDILPRALRYDDGILLVCDDAPCQHALGEKRQVNLQRQSLTYKEKNVWEEASRLLVPKEAGTEEEIQEEAEEELEESEFDYKSEHVDADPFDCTPIKGREDAPLVPGRAFQRYQFYLPGEVRPSKAGGWDPGQRPNHSPILDSVPEVVGSIPINGIRDAAEAMGKGDKDDKSDKGYGGFSVAPLSRRYDFLNVPRNPIPKTAWVFKDSQFKDFIVRKIEDDAIALYETNPDVTREDKDEKPFRALVTAFMPALKAYYNLYRFFRAGMSEKGMIDDPDFKTKMPKGFFYDHPAAQQKARDRLLKVGIELYGVDENFENLVDSVLNCDVERTKRVWPIFMKVRRKIT
jgi:hypothetical protein